MKIKICTECDRELPLIQFSKDKTHKDGLSSHCKDCRFNYKLRYNKKYPWKSVFQDIKTRCNNKKCKFYKNYGGRGIKCLITEEELKQLWFRDKAYLMKIPSIDRKDNDGNYVFKNCHFIEKSENSFKSNITSPHSKKVKQLDLKNKTIKIWNSIIQASRSLNVASSHIINCAKHKKYYKTAGGFRWAYENSGI
jgi:hypothetical protein